MSKQIVLLLALIALTACTTDPRMGITPPSGKLINMQRAPLYFSSEPGSPEPSSLEQNSEQLNRPPNQKSGTSKASNIVVPFTYNLFSIGWGNASMEQAAKSAGIKKINYADTELFSILGVYNRATVIVYGE